LRLSPYGMLRAESRQDEDQQKTSFTVSASPPTTFLCCPLGLALVRADFPA
jgi:hypothetical protein